MLVLNLLPPEKKSDLLASATLSHWLRGMILLVILTLLGTVGTGATWWTLRQHAQSTTQKLDELQRQQSQNTGTDISQTTSSLNATIKLLASTLGPTRPWSRDLGRLLAALPADITVSTVELQANGQFQLSGIAATRQSFLALEQALHDQQQFQQVSTTSTPSKRNAIPYTFTGQLVASGS